MTYSLPFFILAGTILVYLTMKKLYMKFSLPLLVPTATSTLLIVVFLLCFNINYETYMKGAGWIGELLGPAVVALAFPLYQNRKLLKSYFWPILMGVAAGGAIGTSSGIWIAKILNVEDVIIRSLAPKSVTSPIAMDIAQLLSGSSSLAAVYVMIAGITGAVVGPSLLYIFRVRHFIGLGVALGSASHGIGTARALELGAKEAAVSSVSMILTALIAVFICPIFVAWLL